MSLPEQIRQLSSRKGRQHFGRFAIEGTRIIERALRADTAIDRLLVGETAQHEPRIAVLVADAKARKIETEVATDDVLAELTNGRRLGNVFAVVQIEQNRPISHLTTSHQPPLFVALIDVIEPGNVGAIIRTAHGFDAAGVFTIGRSDPYNPKAVRTTMGSLFRVPIVEFDSAATFLAAMHEHRIETIASVAANGLALPDVVFSSAGTVILLGNEFYGLSAETIAAADQRVTIPMASGIDSFSVSASASILLYAASLR